MSAEHVAKAIMRLDDREVRNQVVAGDFKKFADLELTNSEKALIIEELEPDGLGRNGGATVALLCMDPTAGKRGLLWLSSRYALAGIKDSTVRRTFRAFLKRHAAEL
jgi:hypothetical protein